MLAFARRRYHSDDVRALPKTVDRRPTADVRIAHADPDPSTAVSWARRYDCEDHQRHRDRGGRSPGQSRHRRTLRLRGAASEMERSDSVQAAGDAGRVIATSKLDFSIYLSSRHAALPIVRLRIYLSYEQRQPPKAVRAPEKASSRRAARRTGVAYSHAPRGSRLDVAPARRRRRAWLHHNPTTGIWPINGRIFMGRRRESVRLVACQAA